MASITSTENIKEQLKTYIKETIDTCKTEFSSFMYHSSSLENDEEKADIMYKIRHNYFIFLEILSGLNEFELFKYLINNNDLNATCIHDFNDEYNSEPTRILVKDLLLHLCNDVESKYLKLLLKSKILNENIFPNKIILDTLLYTEDYEKILDIKEFLIPELSIEYFMDMEEALSKTLILWIVSNKNNNSVPDEMIEAIKKLCENTLLKIENLKYYIKPQHILHEELFIDYDEITCVYSIIRETDEPL